MGGWWNDYKITESYNRLCPLAHWIRRRLRAVIRKHWKNRKTRVRELLKRGVFRAFAVTTGCARKGSRGVKVSPEPIPALLYFFDASVL